MKGKAAAVAFIIVGLLYGLGDACFRIHRLRGEVVAAERRAAAEYVAKNEAISGLLRARAELHRISSSSSAAPIRRVPAAARPASARATRADSFSEVTAD